VDKHRHLLILSGIPKPPERPAEEPAAPTQKSKTKK